LWDFFSVKREEVEFAFFSTFFFKTRRKERKTPQMASPAHKRIMQVRSCSCPPDLSCLDPRFREQAERERERESGGREKKRRETDEARIDREWLSSASIPLLPFAHALSSPKILYHVLVIDAQEIREIQREGGGEVAAEAMEVRREKRDEETMMGDAERRGEETSRPPPTSKKP